MTWTELPNRSVPRLGIRFVVVTAIGLLLAGAGILVVVERTLAKQAERQAVDHAKATAAGVLDRRLRASDLRGELGQARRRELQVLFSQRNLGSDSLGARLYSRSGVLVATSGRLAPPPASLIARAMGGQVVSVVVDSSRGSVLQTLVPVRIGSGGTGVVELDQNYGKIAAAARRTGFIVAAILEALLLGLCALLLPHLARASKRLRRQIEQLDHMASHDELTGLLNRPGFRRLIEAELAGEHARGAIVLVDLDRFNEINETIGDDQGDHLLVEAAARLKSAFPGNTSARLGEDEFAVLLPRAGAPAIAEAAETISEVFAAPFPAAGIRLGIDIRTGAARYPDDGTDSDSLLRHGSIALTRAKSAVDRMAVYDPSYDHTDLDQLAVVAELRDALATGQIIVHYQPQVSLATKSVRAVEALVRWQHPQRGLLAPGEFIEVAEQSALISELGRHVLHTSIEQWEYWHDQGIDLDVSVNLSTVDLLDLTLPGTLVDLLLEHQMPADRLLLEITERTLLGREHETRGVLRQLEHIGVCLSIDDYGTGYSSLKTLRELPIAQVKIDRSFVAGIPDDQSNDEIVNSTIQLAHALGATVVAEGVETEAQLHRLAQLGCDSVQGYLLGRPKPARELTAELGRTTSPDVASASVSLR